MTSMEHLQEASYTKSTIIYKNDLNGNLTRSEMKNP